MISRVDEAIISLEIANLNDQLNPEQKEILQKGKRAAIGEIREYFDGKYEKTATGWKYIKGSDPRIKNKAKPEEKPVEKKDKEEEYKKDVSEAEDSMYYLLKKFYKEKPAMSSDRRHIEVAKILAKKYKIKYQDLLKQYTPSRNINGEKYWDKNGEIVS